MIYDFLIKAATVGLYFEAVMLGLILIGYLSTLVQKNLREAEAAKAQTEAWQANKALNQALITDAEKTQKANSAALEKIVASALVGGMVVPTTH